MKVNETRNFYIQVVLLLILISSLTSGWERVINPKMDLVEESPEFEVVYTDIDTGQESRSPLLNSDVIPFVSEEHIENIQNKDSSNENSDTLLDVSETDTRLKDKRLIAGFKTGKAYNGSFARKGASCTDDNNCDTGKKEVCRAGECASGDDATTGSPRQTPMVYYTGLGVKRGNPCRSVPAAIHDTQTSSVEVKFKKDKFGSAAATPDNFEHPVCNWKLSRLECVPKRVNRNETTTEKSKDKGDSENEYPLGTCQCLLSLGAKAIWIDHVDKTKSGTSIGKCFIPANRGHHSKCGHEIVIPSGQIDTGKKVIRYAGLTSSFCAPGSICRTGYNYVGLRCNCKPRHVWISRTSTCKSTESDKGISRAEITFIIIFLPLVISICLYVL